MIREEQPDGSVEYRDDVGHVAVVSVVERDGDVYTATARSTRSGRQGAVVQFSADLTALHPSVPIKLAGRRGSQEIEEYVRIKAAALARAEWRRQQVSRVR